MAKTNRRPIDRFERKQRLAQRVSHDEHQFNRRAIAAMGSFNIEDNVDFTDEEAEYTLNS